MEKVSNRHPTLKGNSTSSFPSIKEFPSCHHFQSTEDIHRMEEHGNSDKSERHSFFHYFFPLKLRPSSTTL